MKELEHQVRNISEYVEGQASGESVVRAERMLSTRVLGREHEVWDVRTTGDRYWVVTNPTNLYSQNDFESADYALTFHLGIGLRLAERGRVEIDEELEERVEVAWRKYEQAVEAFSRADEAEAFQAVGVHCREALIAAVPSLALVVPDHVADRPKAGDFKGWANLAAEAVAEGRLRAYLKAAADSSWDLTVWLQHFGSATPWDVELVLDATQHVISTFGMALLRHDRGQPDRCPRCSSYRVESDGGVASPDPYVQWQEKVCGACEYRWDHRYMHFVDGQGWVETPAPPGAGT